jgi:MoaA/NifB/PqqE/SkfB family radical SAM enzyme
MSFTEFLQIPELAARYNKVRKYFFLRESTYDLTSVCQLRCEGCYYFSGDKSIVTDVKDGDAWRELFRREKERGVTFVVLAGAEPALVPQVLQAAYDIIPLGILASNGLKRIDRAIGFRIHLSVWGDQAHDPVYRRNANGRLGPNCLPIQLANYKDDERVIFVYTFNNENVDQLDEVLKIVSDAGHKISFNVFSNPEGKGSTLKFQDTLRQTRDKMYQAIDEYPETVVYSYYNAEVHTHEKSLHELFGCVYPRALMGTGQEAVGIGKTFRSYRADLTHNVETDCCVPHTDCADCRHYGSGSAIIPARLLQHTGSEEQFRAWLDYVDTYLAVWVPNYTKGENLYTTPGRALAAVA